MTGNPEEHVIDSPTSWVAGHIRDYVTTNGETGHIWNGVQTLLLTTRGRKSGKLRRTALIYGRDGDRYVVVGSNGGRLRNPSWFLNLQTQPEVYVQVGADRFTGRAHTATTERPRLWDLMTSIFPMYEEYQKKTSREIPVVIIEQV